MNNIKAIHILLEGSGKITGLRLKNINIHFITFN